MSKKFSPSDVVIGVEIEVLESGFLVREKVRTEDGHFVHDRRHAAENLNAAIRRAKSALSKSGQGVE